MSGLPGDPATLRAARLARLRDAAPAEPAAAVLRFRRPGAPAPAGDVATTPAEASVEAPAPACDLDGLPGAGPGLVGALRRAGFACRADLAPLAPEELALRLGPLGGLVPAQAWIAAARAGTA
ncbi:hypothetical protein [Amaricoccus sp.]|uniref:hypothetical protein n=1 Tax=Amaricoccus sp. TaxID=1872485 RepID=UPI001B62503D|nr:hypothetical protein [Amaricoccus sp.]MBP7003143.1 hypothetical protein [Amaricoccus sp.]